MPSLKNEALYQQRASENPQPRLGYEKFILFAISVMQQKIRILVPCICFPERKSRLPEVEEIFPHPESYFPEIESVFPEVEEVFPALESPVPQRETVFPRLEDLLPDIEKVFPDLEPKRNRSGIFHTNPFCEFC
jgi:hypothetical protein